MGYTDYKDILRMVKSEETIMTNIRIQWAEFIGYIMKNGLGTFNNNKVKNLKDIRESKYQMVC